MDGLSEEEDAVVMLVREFVDREVRPTARELEHGNVYPVIIAVSRQDVKCEE